MSVVLHVEAAAHLLATYTSLQREIPSISDTDPFLQVIAHKIRHTAIPGFETAPRLGDELCCILGLSDGQQRNVLEVLCDLTQQVLYLSPTVGGVVYRCALSDVTHARRYFPIDLLLAAYVAGLSRQSGQPYSGGYPSLALPESAQLRALFDQGLADCHVHLGGAVPFSAVFLMAMDGFERVGRERASVETHPSDAGVYRVDYLLFAAKIILRLLWGFCTDPNQPASFRDYVESCSLIRSDLRKEMLDGLFWRLATTAALHNPRSGAPLPWRQSSAEAFSPEVSGPLYEELQESCGTSDPGECTRTVLVRLLEHYFQNQHDSDFSLHLAQLVRCLCILYGAITPSSGGLHEFTRQYERQRYMRREGGMQLDDVVRHALGHLTRGGHLTRLELRASVQSASEREGIRASQLADRCADFLESYSEFVDDPQSLKVMLACTLRRTPDERGCAAPHNADASEAECRWQFGHLWKTMGEIAELWTRCPRALRFFGIMDVAGEEDRVPNWVFHVLFEELLRRLDTAFRRTGPTGLSITFTVHAGECFDTPLNGLRRIGEVVDHMSYVTRLGHALSLIWPSWWDDRPLGRQQALFELLDDLIWAHGRLLGQVKHEAEDMILDLASRVYGEYPDLPTLKRAQALRFDSNALVELGLLGRGPLYHSVHATDSAQELSYNGVVGADALESSDPALRLLARYVARDYSDHDSSTALSQDLKTLLRAAHEQVAPHIRSALSQRGVVLELCPTSNLVVANIPDYQRHPIFDLTLSGDDPLAVTLNTDDPGLFHVTIEDEYAAVWDAAASHQALRAVDTRKQWLEGNRQRGMDHTTCNLNQPGVDLRAELQACIANLREFSRNGA